MFEQKDYEWLMIIECLKKTGMTLMEIRAYIDMAVEGDSTIDHRKQLFEEQRKETAEKMAELRKMMEVLDFKCWYYEIAQQAAQPLFQDSCRWNRYRNSTGKQPEPYVRCLNIHRRGKKRMKIRSDEWSWTRKPETYTIEDERIEIVTQPHTDLWQRTYYHFRNDNAPVLQIRTSKPYFSFTVKTEFESKHRFDQCGIIMYLDSENWLKASIEYENETFQHLGSVVTNNGYSDWATTEIPADIRSMWYRFSRREDDFRVECSEDGVVFSQMRICHMFQAGSEVQFGIYACSPEDSSFKAVFTDMDLGECTWKAHDGQAPDEE